MNRRRGHLRLVATSAAGRRAARTFPCDTNPYGLTPAELRREIARLSRLGWQTWELWRRFCPCKETSE